MSSEIVEIKLESANCMAHVSFYPICPMFLSYLPYVPYALRALRALVLYAPNVSLRSLVAPLCYVPCLPLLLTRPICLACLTCSTCFTQLTYLRCVTCRSGLLAFHTLCTLRALSALSLFVILFTLKETTLRFLDRSI